MPVELFSNLASTTVTSGGTTAPAQGTQETWTVASSAPFPAASSGATPPTQFHVADTAAGKGTEIIAVTNVSGTTWTVTRGAEGTTPVTHSAGFTVQGDLTAAGLGGFLQSAANLSDVASAATARTSLGLTGAATASLPLAVGNGGTGQATAAAALAALGGAAVAGDIGGTSATPQVTATHLASALPVNQGGTGSTTRNFAGLLTPTAVKTGAYTAAAGDYVPCDTTTAAFTVTLPAAPADLAVIGVKMIKQGGTSAVTVAAGGTDVFNIAAGATSLTLPLLMQGVLLQYKASGGIWYVLADDLTLTSLDGRYVTSVTAADTSVVVAGTATAPTVRTSTLDVIAAQHPPAADWSNNSHKITSVTAGVASTDAANVSQTPTGILTTLGDLIYENATPAPARLAGNTTSTKNFLTQTGTGSVSAAPGWGTIAAGDVPVLNQNTTGTAANVTGTVAIGNGGTGQATQQAALDALAGAVTASQVLAGNGTHVTLRALAAADLPAGTTSTQGALQLDGTAGDIQPLAAAAAAGSTGKAADASHVHANTGLVTSVTAADSSVTVTGTSAAPAVASVAAQYTQRIFAV